MSSENVKIVKRIYRSWGSDRSPAASGLLDPEIEWVNPDDAVESGVRRGIAAFEAAVGAVDGTLVDPVIEFEEFIDAGENVVVIGTLRGRGTGSGAVVERRQGYLWTIRDGRAIRFRWFSDPDQALDAAGVRHSSS